MYYYPGVEPDIIYIINFTRKIRLFAFLAFRFYLKKSNFGKKECYITQSISNIIIL